MADTVSTILAPRSGCNQCPGRSPVVFAALRPPATISQPVGAEDHSWRLIRENAPRVFNGETNGHNLAYQEHNLTLQGTNR
jgi:hypothetical protein